MAVTAVASPNSFPQCSTGQLEVSTAQAGFQQAAMPPSRPALPSLRPLRLCVKHLPRKKKPPENPGAS
jgi:hypothetical protein